MFELTYSKQSVFDWNFIFFTLTVNKNKMTLTKANVKGQPGSSIVIAYLGFMSNINTHLSVD